jgi:hypothetical protein
MVGATEVALLRKNNGLCQGEGNLMAFETQRLFSRLPSPYC